MTGKGRRIGTRFTGSGFSDPVKLAATYWNTAPTALLPFIRNVQGSTPEHAPVHPLKDRPCWGAGAKMTFAPFQNFTLQIFFLSGQLRPAGVLVIDPKVFLVILTVYLGSFLKTALTIIVPVGLM